MKNQTDTVEPEFVENETDTETQIRSIAVPTNLSEIAASGQAECIIASRVQIVKTLRKESIRMTRPEDWLLFKDEKTGREIAYLQDTGCQRIAPLWGIETTPVSQTRVPAISNNPEEDFAWETMVDGHCNVTQRNFKGVVGTRFSDENYAKQSAVGIRREVAVKKASRANADGTVTRKASGLNAVPIGDLMDAWDDPKGDRMIPRCAKGRGYGSADQRAGAANEQHGIEPKFYPECPVCKIKLVWRNGKDGKEGFFGCKNYEKHKDTRVIVGLSEAKKRQDDANAAEGRREPGAEG